MTNDQDKPQPKLDAEIELEIRQARKFTAQEAVGRMAGPGAMKGASAVSPQQQAENAVGNWLRDNVVDPAGALRAVLYRHLKGSQLLLENSENPTAAAASYCEQVLASDHRIEELTRESDVEWGRTMDERPYFERQGALPHPDDPYTSASVREALRNAVKESCGGHIRRSGVLRSEH